MRKAARWTMPNIAMSLLVRSGAKLKTNSASRSVAPTVSRTNPFCSLSKGVRVVVVAWYNAAVCYSRYESTCVL